jgi:hypothetical protein
MTWLTVMEYLCHKWPRICSTCRKHFPVLSSFMIITGFVTRLTRRVPLLEQKLLTLPEHLNSLPVFSGVRVTRSLVLCVCFVIRCLSFFLLAIVLSVLRYTDYDYPFGIFKLFLLKVKVPCQTTWCEYILYWTNTNNCYNSLKRNGKHVGVCMNIRYLPIMYKC